MNDSMLTTFRIRRFNPESESPQPYFEDYRLVTERSDTVLDALIRIRETVDESLTLRCSCRGAICGSCGMRINGHATLACKTKVVSLASSGETIHVEPMNNMPVIKDLVTDMAGFWEKIRQVQPWLQPGGPGTGRRVSRATGRHESFDGCYGLHHVRGLRCRTVRPWK